MVAERFVNQSQLIGRNVPFRGLRSEPLQRPKRIGTIAVDRLRVPKKAEVHTHARELRPFSDGCFRFAGRAGVSTDHFNKYVDDRQQAGASNATINRELAALKRMFTLGARTFPQKVTRIPHFPHLVERNVRKGFVEDAQYVALAMACAKVGIWLCGLFECGYTYGWRVSELLGTQVSQINIAGGTIRLNPGETKNDDARTVKMSAGVKVLLAALIAGKKSDDFVFTREGEVVRDFRGAWEVVTTAASVPDLLFHDLRRTAIRNMVRAGIPERVAMSISGHKTRSVFERYNIVSERDLDDAVRKLEVRREMVTKQLQTEAEEISIVPPSSVN